jgi:hypothetical protein
MCEKWENIKICYLKVWHKDGGYVYPAGDASIDGLLTGY